jgi:2-dehydropantoate 2-reductase
MRILTVGAGALGGYYGGMLLKGGADVTFLVRTRRAAQLAERGLIIRTPDSEFTTPVKTVQSGAVGGPYDVVLLACKAYDLDGAVDDFASALASDGGVLPVLNGINHIATLIDRLGAARVLGGVVVFLVSVTPEGDIAVPGYGTGQTSFGELTGQRSARCEAIRSALAAGGVESTISGDIVAEMWAKFCGVGAAAAVAALTRARAGEVAATSAGADFVAAAFDECARIGSAEAKPPPPAIREIVLGLWRQTGSTYGPSILFDIENGRPTEGEHIIGDLVRRADRLGVEAPILRAALCNLEVYEARRRAGLINL